MRVGRIVGARMVHGALAATAVLALAAGCGGDSNSEAGDSDSATTSQPASGANGGTSDEPNQDDPDDSIQPGSPLYASVDLAGSIYGGYDLGAPDGPTNPLPAAVNAWSRGSGDLPDALPRLVEFYQDAEGNIVVFIADPDYAEAACIYLDFAGDVTAGRDSVTGYDPPGPNVSRVPLNDPDVCNQSYVDGSTVGSADQVTRTPDGIAIAFPGYKASAVPRRDAIWRALVLLPGEDVERFGLGGAAYQVGVLPLALCQDEPDSSCDSLDPIPDPPLIDLG